MPIDRTKNLWRLGLGLVLSLLLCSPALGQERELELKKAQVDRLLEQSKNQAKKMKLTDIQPNRKTTQMPDLGQLDQAYQKQLKAQEKAWFGKLKTNRFVGKFQLKPGPASPSAGPAGAGEQVYLLVSSSVPTVTLRNYAKTLSRLKSPRVRMVIRGLVNKDLLTTYRWIRSVIQKDPSCVGADCQQFAPMDINPNPFRDFEITQVPAMVWARQPAKGFGAKPEGYLKLTGDASLLYGLRRFEEAKQGHLPRQLLSQLKGEQDGR